MSKNNKLSSIHPFVLMVEAAAAFVAISALIYLLAYFGSVERSVARIKQGNRTTTMVSVELVVISPGQYSAPHTGWTPGFYDRSIGWEW